MVVGDFSMSPAQGGGVGDVVPPVEHPLAGITPLVEYASG